MASPHSPSKVPVARQFAATLARVEPWTAPQLVDEGGWSRLGAVAFALPAQVADSFYLECGLGSETARADLILGVSDSGRGILAGENPAVALPPDLTEKPVWAALGRFCRRWRDRPKGLHRHVKRIWIEFDASADIRRKDLLSTPRVFVDWMQPLDRAEALGAVETLLLESGELAGHRPGNELLAALLGCVESLSAATSLYSLGFFPEAKQERFRLCVRGPVAQLQRYLSRVGALPGGRRIRELERAVTARPGGDRVRILHLDVGVSGVSKISIEHSLRGLGRKDVALSSYLDRLVAAGWCTRAKREGLGAWPGGNVETLPHQLWPSLAVRWINHVKLTPAADGDWRAKAYLCHKHVPHLSRR